MGDEKKNVPKGIGVPTVGGLKSAMTSYAYGVGGGIVYSLTTNIFGSGFLGSLASAALAGSVIKGVRGEIIATVLGFNGILSAMGGGVGEAGDSGVM